MKGQFALIRFSVFSTATIIGLVELGKWLLVSYLGEFSTIWAMIEVAN
jgi:hypothetical protein